MHSPQATNTGQRIALATGGALILVGLVWLLLLAFGDSASTRQDDRAGVLPPPTSPLVASSTPHIAGAVVEPALLLRLLTDNDMGTGSSEFSAVALNEELERLLIADDDGRIFEFDLQANGEPVVPPRRTIQSRIGRGDIEGLTWLAGNRYAIADEADGMIRVIEISDAAQTIDEVNVLLVIDTQISGADNQGLEGVSYANDQSRDVRWVVVAEQPATLLGFDQDGELLFLTPLTVADASDVWVSSSGVYSVLSDEDRVIVDLEVAESGAASLLGQLELTFDDGRFEQPEGLVRSGNGTRLYVVGESPGPGNFVFGFWMSE